MNQATAEKLDTEILELEEHIRATLDGDKDAFQYLYRYSFSTVENECYKVLHNRQDIDDCMQESYIKIYNNLNKLKEPKSFLGWCRRIAHNVCVSFIDHRERKEGKDNTMPPVGDETQIGLDSIDETRREYDPEESADMELVSTMLSGMMNSLPPNRAQAMYLYQQGYSYQEIAEQLLIPLGTVKSHISYAKRQIHLMVEKIEKEEGIYLHGYTIAPAAAGGYIVKGIPKETTEGSGWIGTSASNGSKHQDSIWKQITKEVPELAESASSLTLGAKVLRVLVIAVAATVIVTSVIYAVRNINKSDTTNTSSTVTTISETSPSDIISTSGIAPNTTQNTVSENNQSVASSQVPSSSVPQTPEATTSRQYNSVAVRDFVV